MGEPRLVRESLVSSQRSLHTDVQLDLANAVHTQPQLDGMHSYASLRQTTVPNARRCHAGPRVPAEARLRGPGRYPSLQAMRRVARHLAQDVRSQVVGIGQGGTLAAAQLGDRVTSWP